MKKCRAEKGGPERERARGEGARRKRRSPGLAEHEKGGGKQELDGKPKGVVGNERRNGPHARPPGRA